MKPAAERAATRRGSSITSLRPRSQPASSSANGTCVVLPTPGGASNTRRGWVSRLRRSAGNSSAMGKSDAFTSTEYGRIGVYLPDTLGGGRYAPPARRSTAHVPPAAVRLAADLLALRLRNAAAQRAHGRSAAAATRCLHRRGGQRLPRPDCKRRGGRTGASRRP